MITFLAVIFVFGILVFIHEFGHFILAKRNGVRVEKFSFGFGPKLLGRKIGPTEYIVSAVPLGGYIKMAGDEPGERRQGASWEFLSQSCGRRAQIIAAGPILNYLLAFFLFSFIFVLGAPALTTRVGELLKDYPAEKAGLKKGDLVLALDGEKVDYWEDLAGTIHQKTSGKIVLDVKRGEKVWRIEILPRIEEHQDIFGQKIKIALIGIQPAEEIAQIKYGWAKSFYEGGKKLLGLSGMTYKSLWFVLTRRLSFKESFAGPIFIFKLTGSAAKMGTAYLLNLMGLLSMSLAIFNFLPLPVLDGGHIFFLLIEKLRKRPLSVRTQEVAAQTGMFLLITLLIFVSYYDMLRSGWVEKTQEFWQKITAQK